MRGLEPVTHFLFGACLSRAGLNRKTGLATLTLTIAAEAADIDVVTYFAGSISGFQHHRGITHTFVGAPFVAAFTLAGVYAIYRIMRTRGSKPRLPPDWKILYIYALIGALSHILLDFTNSYGVRPFEPVKYKWYSWDILFIVDPFVLALLAFALVAPAFLSLVSDEIGARRPQFRGRGAAIFALCGVVALVGLRDFEHRRAVNALEALNFHDEPPLRVSAYATMWNPFSWNGVVETQDFLEAVTVDSRRGEVDPENNALYRHKPEETPVTLAAKKSQLGRVYLDWAQYPYVEAERLPENQGFKVRFEDWRFINSSIGGGRSSPLAGYVELAPDLSVVDEYIGERDDAKPKRR